MQPPHGRIFGIAFYAVLAAIMPPRVMAGESYALLVAIGDYDLKELRPLRYTRADVIDFHAALVESGFSSKNIVLMHDDVEKLAAHYRALGSGQRPRDYLPEGARIRKELQLLLGRLRPDDSVVVAFSGHGVQFRGEKESYFCPADADLEDKSSLIGFEEVFAALKDCSAARKLFLVDACQNDPLSEIAKSRKTVDLDSVTRPQTVAVPEGIIALFSCKAGQKSFELPELGHGIFFHHLLDGWKGNADANRDGRITYKELADHTEIKTAEFAALKLKVLQTPLLKSEFSGEWILRSLPPPVRDSAPGTPDASFGDRGRSFINFGYGGIEDAYALALQRDGKLIVAGEVEKGFQKNEYYFGLARLNPDGSLDTTFDGDGRILLSFGHFDDGIRGRCLAIQPDGKIVCGGRVTTSGWGYEFGLARLLPDGRLDPTFGRKGQVATDLTQRKNQEVLSSMFHALALQPDGRILAAGTTTVRRDGGTQPAFALVRYLSDGRIDASFGKGGGVVTDLDGDREEIFGMMIQADGRIVVAGTAKGRDARDGVVLRYTRNGVLDSSFDGDGVVRLNFGPGDNNAYDLAVQGDKLLVLANGDALKGSAVVRLLPDGRFDASFGTKRSGIAAVGASSMSLAVLADGRIVTGHQQTYSFATLSADGLLESAADGSSAGNRSPTGSAFGKPRLEEARAMLRADDGRVFFAGPHIDGSGRRVMTVIRTHGPGMRSQ